MYRCGLGFCADKLHREAKDEGPILHAIADAILGATGLPDLDERMAANDSIQSMSPSEVVQEICSTIWDKGYSVVNVDVSVVGHNSNREAFRETLANTLNVEKTAINIKNSFANLEVFEVKTGVMVQAIVFLRKRELES